MNDDFRRGILFIVAILIVISFTLDLKTNEGTERGTINPLIIFT